MVRVFKEPMSRAEVDLVEGRVWVAIRMLVTAVNTMRDGEPMGGERGEALLRLARTEISDVLVKVRK